MARLRRLYVERLEDRLAPATFGVPWPDAEHLTLSFAPDGAGLAGIHGQVLQGTFTSQLFALLDAQMDRTIWQTEILRAFQTWAVHANINIGLVEDGGQPFGSSGPVQGDPRFGDIRIATYPLQEDVLAISMPFDVAGGTWTGDVRLNTLYVSNLGEAFDLFSIMLHEAGHVFGLDHSDDPASPMFETYNGATALTAEDIARLQALYGARVGDGRSNDTFQDAERVRVNSDPVKGDLDNLNDVDFFQFKVGGNVDSVVVRLRTAGISLLGARLTVYQQTSPKGEPVEIASVAAAGPLHGDDLTIVLNSLSSNATYYVKIDSATDDVFGIGSYELQVHTGSSPRDNGQGSVKPPTANQSNQVVNLQPRHNTLDSRFDYTYEATLSSGDVDYYRFKSPSPGQGGGAHTAVLTAMVWLRQTNGLQPVLTLYDGHGNVLPAHVLVLDNGMASIQLGDVGLNESFLLAVQGSGVGAESDYFLGIDFGAHQIELDTFEAQRPLTAEAPTHVGTLTVHQSQLFHLVFSADWLDQAGDTAAALTIRDALGHDLISVAVRPGETLSRTFYLLPGDYLFHFSAVTPAGGAAAPLTFTLQGKRLSDPVGPHPVDTTLDPSNPTYVWQSGLYALIGSGGTTTTAPTHSTPDQVEVVQNLPPVPPPLTNAGGSTNPGTVADGGAASGSPDHSNSSSLSPSTTGGGSDMMVGGTGAVAASVNGMVSLLVFPGLSDPLQAVIAGAVAVDGVRPSRALDSFFGQLGAAAASVAAGVESAGQAADILLLLLSSASGSQYGSGEAVQRIGLDGAELAEAFAAWMEGNGENTSGYSSWPRGSVAAAVTFPDSIQNQKQAPWSVPHHADEAAAYPVDIAENGADTVLAKKNLSLISSFYAVLLLGFMVRDWWQREDM